MVETCVSPSELHLKKELTVLGKSRFLRDPDTQTSWKSPLSSPSLGGSFNLNYGRENSENKKGLNNLSGSLELPSGFEKRRRKVYLYNWGDHSSKSSDSGFQLDDDNKKISVQGSLEKIMNNNNNLKLDSENNGYPEDPVNSCDVKGKNPAITVRKNTRKSSRGVFLRKRNKKNSAVIKMLDLTSNSLGVLKSGFPSDDSGYCSSDEIQESKCKLTQRIGCCSQCASPMLSVSGCGNWSNSSKILRRGRREGSPLSCTPVSNSSNNRQRGQMPSTGRSWDRASTSFNGDEVDPLDYNNSRRCSLACSLSKRTRSCSSPSHSDTPSRMVRNILCGSRTVHSKRRSPSSQKCKYVSKYSPGVPLLTNSFDGLGSSTDSVTDEVATNFGELDLEAVSRLDARRWSSCRSHDGLEQCMLLEGFDSNTIKEKCISKKFMPRSFDEIVGQNIVVQSLNSAVLKGRIAPAYLFQGPHGTGKSSIARVFAAALNCLSTEEERPCRLCSECNKFSTGSGFSIKEVDATNKKDIGKIRLLLKKLTTITAFSRYEVFVIDECHKLSPNSWSAFMKFLEEPHSRVVFIFITIDPDSLPRAVVSRCQKYLFPKIKDADIAFRLRKLCAEENLDVEWDAVDRIASNSDGSLRDAETMLDQLCLLGKKITSSLVNDLVGVVSDEKLLDLLEVALSSDTAETVKRSRELMESGVDPVALMSQLAGLIMDFIAGTCRLPRSSSTVITGQSLAEAEKERLQQALKIISAAEKQLRLSSERSTWFTAALLQLGSGHAQPSPSCSSSRPSIKRYDGLLKKTRESSASENKSNSSLRLWESSSRNGQLALDTAHTDDATSAMVPRCVNPNKLDAIWIKCIEKCDSERLRHLLCAHGQLVSITETNGVLIAYIAFGDGSIKSRAERYLRNITNSIAIVLKHNVEVRIGLIPEKYLKALKSLPDSPSSQQLTETMEFLHKEGKLEHDRVHASSEIHRSVDYSENKLQSKLVDEQRLECAWLQAAENGEVPLVCHSKESKQEIHNLTQYGVNSQNRIKCIPEHSISFKHWKDGESVEIEEVETNDSRTFNNEQIGGRIEQYHYPIAPSLLHNNSFRANIDPDSLGYDSGPVRSGFCCWKTQKSNMGKARQGNCVKSQRVGGCFGQC